MPLVALCKGPEGIIYDKKKYEWNSAPLAGAETKRPLTELDKVWRSSISVSDFYLRRLFKSKN